MARHRGDYFGGFVILLCLAAPSRGTVAVIGGADDANIDKDVQDATIFSNMPNNSNGAGPGIFAGTDGNTVPLRGLIKFDVADNIPAGSTIFRVQLELSLGKVAGSGGGGGPGAGVAIANIELHKLAADWGEGTTGAGLTQIGGTGQGFPAGAGDATWDAAKYPSTLWTTPGGDFAVSASAVAGVGTTVNTAYTWGTTSPMVSDVQSWLNDPNANFGWALLNSDETDSRTFRAFWTKVATDPTLRPELVVTYARLPGDLNNDGIVNGQDLALVSSGWLNTGIGTSGDANFDGIVNGQDLALISSNWLNTTNTTSVPEPASALLALAAALIVAVIRARSLSRN
jgi:hypothetical protein